MCRQLSTAMKEMDVIDTIVEQSKRSDLPQDYIQMNANLLQKRQYLVEWVNASNVNKGNLKSKVDAPIKNKSKRNASQIASNDGAKDSGEFQTPLKN
ncbi:hypothetical protein CEXT_356241 [Caerostris extrusa]|uniref:No apical meristem-associated C-terminal domain-containing protein n=1 Tax=Caerostris extrusa TaxID=172846 RepID=A0AAV4WAF8_CAEEX|nr:hypothetical protein CEXT_356241 [Caerostris extrusa]